MASRQRHRLCAAIDVLHEDVKVTSCKLLLAAFLIKSEHWMFVLDPEGAKRLSGRDLPAFWLCETKPAICSRPPSAPSTRGGACGSLEGATLLATAL